jgi:tRNA-2-methylthio-N6-dimethylallyladenosine synthase
MQCNSNKDSRKGRVVYIKSFGCQMNVRDSEVICGLLKKEGYTITCEPDKADIILFNTCSVRQHAEDKVWSEIGKYKKGQFPLGAVPFIGVVGCMAQNYKEKIFERSPNVDFVAGPSDIDKIPQIIRKLSAIRCPLYATKAWETDGNVRPEEIYRTGFYEDKDHAYVVISEGCSNYCSYCVVPYVRGELHNRNYKDIIKEIEQALDRGISEVTLLGQNVNGYQYNGVNFMGLVNLVNLVKGLKEFSFITSHPKDTSIDLFKAMADLDKLKKYLHLPAQSGSDRILKLMNRGYSREFYLDLAQNYRKIVKDGILTTDIIVGFSTETDRDFQDTYDLAKDIQFNASFIFKYSVRPNTEAAAMIDDVPKEEKEKRHKLILDLQKGISNKLKTQKLKPKTKIKNSKLLVLSCSFAFLVLRFAFTCYALNLDKIKVNFLEGDYKAAISEGEKLIAQDPHSDELYYILALSYLKDGNILRASDIFEIILKEFKDSRFKEDARLSLGDTYFLRGDFVKARDHYYGLISSNSQTKFKAGLYYRLSQIGAKLGDTRQAKEYMDKLNQAFPLNLESRVNNDLSSLLGPASDIYYTVQVGSFTNITNASNLKARLIQKGYPAYIEEASSKSQVSYRVKVGRTRLRHEIVSLEKKLSLEGYPTKICP